MSHDSEEKTAVLTLNTTRLRKSSYVALSREKGLKVAVWADEVLAAAAAHKIEEMAEGLKKREQKKR